MVQKQLDSHPCAKTRFLSPPPFSLLSISLVSSKAVDLVFISCGFSAVIPASVSIDYSGSRIFMLRSQLNIIFSFNLEISFRVTFFFFCNPLHPFFKFLNAVDPARNRREHVSLWLTFPS